MKNNKTLHITTKKHIIDGFEIKEFLGQLPRPEGRGL